VMARVTAAETAPLAWICSATMRRRAMLLSVMTLLPACRADLPQMTCLPGDNRAGQRSWKDREIAVKADLPLEKPLPTKKDASGNGLQDLSGHTPMMQQYLRIKAEHPNALLF